MKIMVCTDGSELADKAIRIAAQLAQVRGSDMTIMHVIEADISRKEPIDELMQQSKLAYDQYGEKYRKAKSILQDAEKVVAEIGKKIQVNLRIALGPVSAEIVRIAEEEKIGALFIGSTGSGKFKRMLMGSAADDVIHYAHCPVTVVR